MQNTVCWNNREYFAFMPSVKKRVRENSFSRKIACGGHKLKVDRPHAILLPVTTINIANPNSHKQPKYKPKKSTINIKIPPHNQPKKHKKDSKKPDHL